MDIKEIIQAPVKTELAAFKNYYSGVLSSDIPILNEALVYVGDTVGKMMRPILVLLAARSCGNVCDATFSAAAALELLHTASLLHDDVIDESDMRRGQPSLNAVYSNRVAILTGDYLFSSSLNCIAKTKNIEIIETLSDVGRALSSGEMMQLQFQKSGGFCEENYLEMIRRKTAALFACCGKLGALSAGVDSAVAAGYERFGELLGICFQIRDDIFDYFDSNIGKPTGSDMREGKITLPALYVLRTLQEPAVARLNTKLQGGDTLHEEEISELIEFSKNFGGIDYALERIDTFRSEALSALPPGIPDDCRVALESYLDYSINRKK